MTDDKISGGEKLTVNISWPADKVGLPDDVVRLRVHDPKEGKLVTVRRVDNDGSATVTFPKSFKGERKVQVKGPDGEVNGEIEVGK